MFRVFHLAWSTCRATNIFVAGWRKLLRKVERGSALSNKFWLCCCFFHRARNLSWIHTKQANQSARCISSTRNNFFVARQVDHERWKTRNIDPKLATKKCFAKSWGLLYLVFRRLNAGSLFKCKLHSYIWVIDQVWGQDGWILAKFFFHVFTNRDGKTRNKRTRLD